MFCVLLPLILYLSVASYPQWLARTRAVSKGGPEARIPPLAP